MADPQDFQFELDGVLFGLGCDVAVEASGFDPGSTTWTTQDRESQTDDVVYMGRDVKVPSSWSWQAFTTTEDPQDSVAVAEALAAVETLQGVWEPEEVRSTPGTVSVLRYKRPGAGVRRVYGRPRRFAAPLDNLLLHGRVDITMDFRRADPLHYDDVEESVVIGMLAAEVGGFPVPAVTPWTSVDVAEPQARTIRVGGTAPTWPVITFRGPQLVAPWVQIGGVRCALQVTMSPGDEIVVDTRPWVRTAYRNGAPQPALLAPATSLADMKLTPGAHEVLFGGSDPTNNATVEVAWRSATRTL